MVLITPQSPLLMICITMFKKKAKKESSALCRYISADDCPHLNGNQCYYNKQTCALEEENKERKKQRWKPRKVVISAILSCVVIVALEIVKLYCVEEEKQLYDILNVLIGGCFSVIAASLIALFVDIPSSLQQYERHFANMLSSNTYLKVLDGDKLNRLRRDVTSQIHKTEVPNLPDGLVRMDEEICDLFNKPYYERYSHLVQCKIKDGNPRVIEKEHVVEYKLINPGAPKSDTEEVIKISNLIMQRSKDDKGISDFTLSYQVDDGEERKLDSDFDMAVQPLEKKIEFYTAKVFLSGKDKSEGARVRFRNNLRVKYSYRIDVDINDRCFTKRLQHPAKLFIMNYSCADNNIRLHGQILGTKLKQSNMSIQYLDDNSVNLVSYDWLLPDNGAIVVMLDKEPKSNNEGFEN